MLSYIIRRLAYSILIVFGVLLLTFLLFRTAAGDPAAAILGKSPTPREVEELRRELGTDRPILYGHWRTSEIFTSADFSNHKIMPNVLPPTTPAWGKNGIKLAAGETITFKRNFGLKEIGGKMVINHSGNITVNGSAAQGKLSSIGESEFSESDAELVITGGCGGAEIAMVRFYRRQQTPWDSQLCAAIFEICSFTERFPYVTFLNFGRTLMTREPIKDIVIRGIYPSLGLMLPIFLGELLLGIILALFCTAFKGRWPDRLIVIGAVAGMSVSYLVFIIFGQWYLGYYFNIFPVWGWGTLHHLFLPVIIGIASGLGGGVRFYRTVFVNELNKEYLRTAAAKGCNQLTIYGKHLLRNAAIPVITRAAAALPFLFTGSLLLETFFGIPGLGYAGIEALNNSDLQLLKALVIVSALLFVVINLITDIAYAWADPRIRLSR